MSISERILEYVPGRAPVGASNTGNWKNLLKVPALDQNL